MLMYTSGSNRIAFEIDHCDYREVSKYLWYPKINRPGGHIYIIRWYRKKPKSIGSLILGIPSTDIADHIDGNTLNNKRSNLRIATNSENVRSQKIHKNNTSGYKGVTWDKGHKKWLAQIMVNYKNCFIGYYDNPAEAHKAYFERAKVAFGVFARAK
jgi:hypothetical protein